MAPTPITYTRAGPRAYRMPSSTTRAAATETSSSAATPMSPVSAATVRSSLCACVNGWRCSKLMIP